MTLYAGYLSYKATKSNNQGQIQRMLVFWIIYGIWQMLEVFLDLILYNMAIYPEIKMGFVAFLLFTPPDGGAKMLYDAGLEQKIGAACAFVEEKVGKAKQTVKKEVGASG